MSLSADLARVASGGSTTLRWSSTDATTCTAGGAWSGDLGTSGSRSSGSVSADSTYTVTCTGPGGSTTASVDVRLFLVNLTADATSLGPGESTTLRWNAEGATSCTATGGWTGGRAASGAQSTGALSASRTFGMTCTGSVGSASASLEVAVVSFQLSGSIAIAETSAVDSDTNDVNQTDYQVNDSPGLAQSLATPVMVVGSVNLPGTGPRGKNYFVGDESDYFIADLVAGQVVELEFASDPSQSDVDLFLYDTGENEVGFSEGVDSRFECVSISRSGRYYIEVFAFNAASIYNLRIGAPGTSGNCAQSTQKLDFEPGELIAEPRRKTGDMQAAMGLLNRAGLSNTLGGTALSRLPAGAGPQRLTLPRDPARQAAALQALGPKSKERAATGKLAAPSKGEIARRSLSPSDLVQSSAVATLKMAKRLRGSGEFEYAEPNWIAQQHAALVGTYPPDDLKYPYQRWHYEQIGLPAAMGRLAALTSLPAQRPIVAVIDDGVVLNHPDLAPQLVSPGRTFVTGADSPSGDNLAGPGDQPVFHGTHVAGTIAAQTFDGIGAAGVAPMALILPLRVFPAQGGARSDDIIHAMRYAARLSNRSGLLPARRADVINMSLGGDRACDSAYQTAINDVRAAGVIVVVSAGNSGRNNQGVRVPVGSPANCNGAIAVSATDALRRVTYYSNTGSALDVAAPGGDSTQTVAGTGVPDNVYSSVATFDARNVRQPTFGGMMGTSMAAPHVSGVMALMRYVNPAITVAQVDSLLAAGRLTDAVGNALDFGNGLINARKAVDEALVLAGGGQAPPAQLVAQPTAIDVGSFASSAAVQVVAPGTSNERVTSLESVDAPAGLLIVNKDQVDPVTGLGTYVFQIDRAALSPSTGTFYPRILFGLSSGRTLTVQLTIQVLPSGSPSSAANLGPMYVLLIDPESGQTLQSILATLSNGRYSWAATAPYNKQSVAIIAGGDLDNDLAICQRGEPCGAFPVLPPAGDLFAVDLTNGRTRVSGSIANLDFQAAPLSGISPNSAAKVAPGVGGWRRAAADILTKDAGQAP